MPFLNANGSWACDDDGGFAFTPNTKSIHEDNLWTPGLGVSSAGGLTMAAKVGLSKNLTHEEAFALTISFKAAVEAYDRNISNCFGRMYNRSGEEVVDGPPV